MTLSKAQFSTAPRLIDLGWDDRYAPAMNAMPTGSIPGRVVAQHRGTYRIEGPYAEAKAVITGLSGSGKSTIAAALEAEVDSAASERSATEREIADLDALLGEIAAAASVTLSDEGPATGGWDLQETDFGSAADEWSPDFPESEFDRSVSEAILDPAEPADDDTLLDVGALAPIDDDEVTEPAVGGTSTDHDLGEITSFADAAEAMADRVDRPAADDDIAFLDELDRTIAATAPRTPAEDETPEEARPQPGLKCPECGYSNDPAAWYCGVCGVDLG